MKAKTFLFLGIVLVAAGAFPAAFYLGQLAWQVIGMFQARAFALPGALLPALGGLAAMAIGALCILRQKVAIRAERQRKEDRKRRLQDYRRDPAAAGGIDERREPYLGTRDRRVA